MDQSPEISRPHVVEPGLSYDHADVVVVSTDEQGTPIGKAGHITAILGYGSWDFPSTAIRTNGFFWLQKEKRKPVLLIVADDIIEKGAESIIQNRLGQALSTHYEQLMGKTVWLPLLGTSENDIHPSASLRIILSVIEELNFPKDEVRFLISLPDNDLGWKLMDEFGFDMPVQEAERKQKASKKTGARQKSATPKLLTYAQLIADGTDGTDHLRFDTDVRAFARVMAARSFQPPLAIALFGQWGSGKSFFMEQLQRTIPRLAANNDSPYCQGIAQIHFNAWSYLDANLWAGIVTRIFEGLSEYISGDTKANKEKEAIERELSEQLNVTREEVKALEQQKGAIESQINGLRKDKSAIDQRLKRDITSIRKQSLKKGLQQAMDAFGVREKVDQCLTEWQSALNSGNHASPEKARAELKQIIGDQYWENPDALYAELRSTKTFLRTFFKRNEVGKNIVWLTIGIAIIILAPMVIEMLFTEISFPNVALPQIGLPLITIALSAWRRTRTTYRKLQPLLASFWNLKTEYEQEMQEVRFRMEQEEKALKLRIEQGNRELTAINDKMRQAQVDKQDLEFRIRHALATESLYSFIEKRSGSSDYQKYLGIVSIIRNDFKILSELFLEHHGENSKGNEAFRKKFDRPLERIILYIDDLDRCPENRVVEVLEAVNLLMAFPLFVVVVGVDPRWIKNALVKQHRLQFAENAGSNGSHVINPANYLEKIFQVPFHVKAAEDGEVKTMLRALATPIKKPGDKSAVARGEIPGTSNTPTTEKSAASGNSEVSATENSTSELSRHNEQSKKYQTHTETRPLELSENEIKWMQDLSQVVGNNPRAIKRFVNVYQIIRAHEAVPWHGSTTDPTLLKIMFILALSIGPYREWMQAFHDEASGQNEKAKTLDTFLQDQGLVSPFLQWFQEVKNDQSIKAVLQTDMRELGELTPFIRRFTFDDCQ